MVSFTRVAATVTLNLLLALIFVAPLYFVKLNAPEPNAVFQMSYIVALTNIFDALLAFLFVCLAILLLIHRATWPLLNRTLFRMADIGTKGRRAILTAVGTALLSTSVFHDKIPDLLKEIIRALGG
jgi:hypothetical protein